MALEFKLSGDILEVKETIIGWFDAETRYWYYDIKNWMRSITGKKNAPLVQHCTDEAIAWVRKYYLPKVRAENTFI